jgi:hypothetical protein
MLLKDYNWLIFKIARYIYSSIKYKQILYILIMHDSTILDKTSIIESRLISSQISWINEHWTKITTLVEL